MFELRKYHGDRVMSLTYEDDAQSFSVGILSPGEYQFGSIRSELFTVTSGAISLKVENNEKWTTHAEKENFAVPERKNFTLRVDKVSTYICYYK